MSTKVVRLTDADLAKIPAPPGTTFARRPTLNRHGILTLTGSGSIAEYETSLQQVLVWAKKHRLGVSPSSIEWTYFNNGARELRVLVTVKLTANKPAIRKKWFDDALPCVHCETPFKPGKIVCTNCRNVRSCVNCAVTGVALVWRGDGAYSQHGYCLGCVTECTAEGCKKYAGPKNGALLCEEHDPIIECYGCQRRQRTSRTWGIGAERRVCERCAAGWCTTHDGTTGVAWRRPAQLGARGSELPEAKCDACEYEEVAKKRKPKEKFSEVELPRSGSLVIPSLPERPFRTVSIEIEYDSPKPNLVSQILYREGLIETPVIGRYSAMGQPENRYPCVLKSDGSVSGGELVAFLMNLDDEEHARHLMRVLEVMNGLKNENLVSFSHRAGGHIHHDAHNVSVGDAYALVTLYNYLENMIHHLAGAGHSFGHRSLQGNHHGSAQVLKGPFGGKRAFGSQMPRFSRASLNIQHFVRAMDSCVCGARMYEAWAECTCVLPKNTIEWRVWNATGTPRILHGWIAFMQSLVSYATAIEIDEADFPVHAWIGQGISRDDERKLNERLRWVFSHLPLTADEKDSLVYCVQKSQMGEFAARDGLLDELLGLPPAVEFDAKPQPRNPNRREIRITKPSKEAVRDFNIAR